MGRVLLFGAGATGARIARQLRSSGVVDELEIRDPNADRLRRLLDSLGEGVRPGIGRRITAATDAVVIASPPGTQVGLARRAVHEGVAAVTTSNQTSEVRHLLTLDDEARYRDIPVVVGAGFMPGLTCLLCPTWCPQEFDDVDEIHVAKVGTGGPACARQHHRALSSTASTGVTVAGPVGREDRDANSWFPDPVGGRDCYRAALPDALLLVPNFERVQRVTARQAATRNDRLTAPLPMLRRPHPEGGIGLFAPNFEGGWVWSVEWRSSVQSNVRQSQPELWRQLSHFMYWPAILLPVPTVSLRCQIRSQC